MPLSPKTLRPANNFTPKSISGLALWLDAADSSTTYTTDAGPVTAVSAPTDIAGCVAWYDASRADTLFAADTGSTLATTTVGRWANLGTLGSAADLLQAAPNDRPSCASETINGLRVLTFDGVSDTIRAGFTLAQPSHVIAVFRCTSAPSPSANVSLFDGYGAINRMRLFTTDTGTATFAGSQVNQTELLATLTTARVRSYLFSGASSTSHRDGVFAVTGNVGTNSANGLTLAAIGSGASGFTAMSFAEIIIFNTALSTTDRARVEAYLAQRWGISGVHAQATASSDPVGYWGDKSGNARHATQATGASRLTVSGTALNNRKQLGLVSQHLRGPSLSWNGSVTAYWVGRTGQASNGAIVFHDGSTDQTDAFHCGWLNTQGVGAYGNGWGSGNAPRAESPSAWRSADIVAGITLSSTEAIARVNGATVNTTAALTGTLSQSTPASFYIGREASGTWANLNGTLAELLIYQPALSASQRQRIERYLAAKWGITLAPQVSNADAQDWVNRVYANGGTASAATAAAVNDFCNAIDAAGIRDRFYRLNLFCGGVSQTTAGLNACLVPLYRGIAYGASGNVITKSTSNDGGLFSSSLWAVQGSATKGGAVSSPDGATGGLSLTLAGGPSYAAVRWLSAAGDWTANATGTFSVWARKPASGGATALRIATNNTASWNTGVSQKFTLTTEWQRFSVTGTISTGTQFYALIGTVDGASGSHDADCNGIVEIWRPQVEAGSTATAWQACQYGNTTDTNNGPFVSSDYSEAGGLTGNGSSKYLQTGFPGNTLATGNRHLSVYESLRDTNAYRAFLGTQDDTGGTYYFTLGNNSPGTSVFASFGAQASSASHTAGGHWIASDASSSSLVLYKNGASVASSSSPARATPSAQGILVFATNASPSSVFASGYYGGRFGGYSIGLGMTQPQASAYYTAMQAFQTALSRNV